MRMHTPAGSGLAIMGFSSGVWCSFERSLCHRSTVAHARRGYGLREVWKRFVIAEFFG